MRAGGAVRAGAAGMVMVMVVTNEGRFYTPHDDAQQKVGMTTGHGNNRQ
jgi:hypothetical protein